jgi:pimeloyl-ACP methyl ester carboxylesterase
MTIWHYSLRIGRSSPSNSEATDTRDISRPLPQEFLADDMAGLLDHLDVTQTDLVRYSLGAGVALQVAIRYPSRVRRLAGMPATYRSDGRRLVTLR